MLPPLLVAIPLAVGSLLAAGGKWLPRRIIDTVATVTAATVTVLAAILLGQTRDGRVVSWMSGWTPTRGHSVGIVLVADSFSAGLTTLIAALATAAFVYSWRFFENVEALFHVLLLFFVAGMAGFALTGDLFNMFVFFELMGAVAYALTGYRIEEPRSLQGAVNFGIVNSLGAYCTLTGIALLYARTGELGLAQIGAALTGGRDALVVAAFTLVCTGFLVKAAMVPFHFWLADAHAVAPSPVCLLFSGVMVELGVYAVARVTTVVFGHTLPGEAFTLALLSLGTVTAVVGAVMCCAQHHLKRLLAYSTISHVGLFLLGVALLDHGGLGGAGIYVVGHAAAKGALFLATGTLLDRYGNVDEGELHGVGWRSSPGLAAVWMVAGVALAGLPPFGTFLGKSLIEDAMNARGMPWGFVVFTVCSALTGGAILRAGLRIFFGVGTPAPRPTGVPTVEEPETGVELPRVPVTMLAPMAVLTAVPLAMGFVPGLAHAFADAAARFADRATYLHEVLLVGAAAHPPLPVPPTTAWTVIGTATGVAATLGAFAVAAVALGRNLAEPTTSRAARWGQAALDALRGLHSGHVGDYVAWLAFGIAVFAAFIGLY